MSQSIPIPPGRQAEIELDQAIERIVRELGEMQRVRALINEDTPHRVMAERLVTLGEAMRAASEVSLGYEIFGLLTGLREAAELWLEAPPPDDGATEAIRLLTGSMSLLDRSARQAERAARTLGFGPAIHHTPSIRLTPADNDHQLRAFAERVAAIRRELGLLVQAKDEPAAIETQPEIVQGYAKAMEPQLAMTDVQLAAARGGGSDFAPIARPTLAMADLTGDFSATIRDWGSGASAGVRAATRRMVKVVDRAVRGVGTIVRARIKRHSRPTPGTIHCDGPDYPELVLIPAGTFTMGVPEEESAREKTDDDDARPLHDVTIAKPFWMGRYPVTRGEYAAFVTDDRYDFDGGKWRAPGFAQTDRDPVVNVRLEDAFAYVAWLSRKTGHTYRLPSEAEWEYAARARTQTARFWGDAYEAGAKDYVHRGLDTAPVDGRSPNPFGLHDMLGNVWEWCADPWHPNYVGAPTDGSNWASSDKTALRVARGGSWVSSPRIIRAGDRGNSGAHNLNGLGPWAGFRVVRT